MVEAQKLPSAALNTHAGIALPDLSLHRSGDSLSPWCWWFGGRHTGHIDTNRLTLSGTGILFKLRRIDTNRWKLLSRSQRPDVIHQLVQFSSGSEDELERRQAFFESFRSVGATMTTCFARIFQRHLWNLLTIRGVG
ncbi:hypothetical protein BK656_12490 [Pseudomonas brassicacearum]|nr:hypothetical protein BK656_12490 [Pseudomonas brassicacearum]